MVVVTVVVVFASTVSEGDIVSDKVVVSEDETVTVSCANAMLLVGGSAKYLLLVRNLGAGAGPFRNGETVTDTLRCNSFEWSWHGTKQAKPNNNITTTG